MEKPMSLLKPQRQRATPVKRGHAQSFIAPANLAQPDGKGCLSAVVANILYMFGKTTSPQVEYVDRWLGREPGKLVLNGLDAQLFLLNEGFSREGIGVFDSQRAVNEGLPYYREHYGAEWNEARKAYFTQEKIKELQVKRREHAERLQAFAGRNRDTVRLPAPEDIKMLLQPNTVIVAYLQYGTGVSVHACLLYGQAPNGEYQMYEPRTERPDRELRTLFLPKQEDFVAYWCAKAGISAYKLER